MVLQDINEKSFYLESDVKLIFVNYFRWFIEMWCKDVKENDLIIKSKHLDILLNKVEYKYIHNNKKI